MDKFSEAELYLISLIVSGFIFAKGANSPAELEKGVKKIMASARSLMPSVERLLRETQRDG